MEVTVKKVDGKLIAEIPAEELEKLGAVEGEKLVVDGDEHTLSVRRAEDTKAIISKILKEDHEVLARLAVSERMDMVDEIMDEYAEALEELAK